MHLHTSIYKNTHTKYRLLDSSVIVFNIGLYLYCIYHVLILLNEIYTELYNSVRLFFFFFNNS